jgi:dienelactone hydrolase
MFAELDAGSPYDRSPKNGFRCAKFGQPVAPALLAEVREPKPDYTRSPVGDKEFGTYKSLFYTYDRNKDLRVVQGTSQDNDEWRHETVSFDAGYGGERLPAHLFLPKHAAPPYQTVIFFPDGYATGIKDSNGMDIRWFRFLVQTGRAVLCPVFKGTYERQVPDVDILEFTAPWAKEVGRSIDYLKSRGDCDIGKVAFSGFSLGARMGPIVGVVEDRLRTVILLAGGFIEDGLPPQSDPLNFAPRVRMPVLMINGHDDFFAPRVASDRMFNLFGTPDKKHVFIEGGHGLARLEQVQAEVLAWLDAHLGKVQTKR